MGNNAFASLDAFGVTAPLAAIAAPTVFDAPSAGAAAPTEPLASTAGADAATGAEAEAAPTSSTGGTFKTDPSFNRLGS